MLNYPSNTLMKQCWLMLVLAFTLLSSFALHSEPHLAAKNNLKCAACHVNPNGGGMRNDFGRIYGQAVLPAKPSSFDSSKMAQLSPFLAIGADARFNALIQKSEQQNDQTSKSFEISSSQLYFNFVLPDSGISLYIDQQVAPGTAINREAFVMYQMAQGDFIKAGKIYLPYGLRIEDDSAFIRQATGMNFDNSDNGVELGLNYERSTINLYMANGTSQSSNDDNNFLYGVRAEHLFERFRIGTSALINDSENKVTMLNLYASSQLGDLTLLAEVDYLRLSDANAFNQQDITQLVSLAEINYQWRQGWNVKLSAEYFDPDRAVAQDQQTRYSLVAEYIPISNIQLRLGLRTQRDIPQKPQRNTQLLFLQSHFYF